MSFSETCTVFSAETNFMNIVEWHQISLALKACPAISTISPGSLWLTHVMVATQEAEIRKMGV
jgi:hypothetical protein